MIVARYADLTERDLPGAPLLAVEVISPTSRLRDASLKRAVYARLGVPSFWLIDPDPERPASTAFQLAGSGYLQEAHVVGNASWATIRPFRLSLVPAELVAGLRP